MSAPDPTAASPPPPLPKSPVVLPYTPPWLGGNGTEAAALLAFKGRLSDSKALEDWSRSSPSAPCDWVGMVSCDAGAHVIIL